MKQLIQLRSPLLLALVVLLAGNAQAATVTFSMFDDDDNDPAFFNTTVGVLPTQTKIGGTDNNTLFLGVNAFRADTSLPGADVAGLFHDVGDTFSFRVEAPTGFLITGFVYEESVSGGVGDPMNMDPGFASAKANITVSVDMGGNQVSGLGSAMWFQGDASTVKTIMGSASNFNLGGGASVLDITIHDDLNAVLEGFVEKQGASFAVTVAPIPLPPAVWLLGSALLGLTAVRRRRN